MFNKILKNKSHWLYLHIIFFISLFFCFISLIFSCSQNAMKEKSSVAKQEDKMGVNAEQKENNMPQERNLSSGLKGKRICIDPGHGGNEAGAVGEGGLKEKDVNLKVCLFLKEMLENEGAIVLMTRTEDKAVAILDRPNLNKKNNSDLFVSIHHNANAQADKNSNRSEMFYHWKDRGGPSQDVAVLVMREMQAKKKLPDSKVYMCWAYGVLRENMYPAILGEFSYISNPEEEKELRKEDYCKMEAEAYFLGIKKFFEGGRPKLDAGTSQICSDKNIISIDVIHPKNSALIDPQRFKVEIDGKEIDYFYEPDSSRLFAQIEQSLLKENSEALITVRNLAGHVSDVYKLSIEIPKDKKVKKPIKTQQIKILQESDGKSDSKTIDKQSVKNAKILVKGKKNFFTIADKNGIADINIDKKSKINEIIIYADGFWKKKVKRFPEKSRRILLTPIFNGALHDKKIVVDPEGGGDYPGVIGKTGLRASDANLETALYLYQYLKQAGADVSITRTIDMSMDNVSRVRFGLEKNPDIFLSIGHRLPEPGMDENPGSNISRIGHRWDDGGNIGKSLIFHLRELLGTGEGFGDVKSRQPLKSEIHNWSSWEVMHAAQKYSALYVCPQMFDAHNVEERIATTAGCRKEALAIFYGLLQYYGLDDTKMGKISGVVIDSITNQPIVNALICLDDTFVVQTEKDGKFILKYLSPENHTVKIECEGCPTYLQEIKLEGAESKDLEIKI